MSLRVLVFGGRRYADRARVFSELDAIDQGPRGPITCVIDGHCKVWNEETKTWDESGADRWAHEWAVERRRGWVRYPAEWKRYGRSAGPRRNHQMLETERPHIALGFPGDDGTAGMAAIARKKFAATMEWPQLILIDDTPNEKRAP